jgi:hypothetical protein
MAMVVPAPELLRIESRPPWVAHATIQPNKGRGCLDLKQGMACRAGGEERERQMRKSAAIARRAFVFLALVGTPPDVGGLCCMSGNSHQCTFN